MPFQKKRGGRISNYRIGTDCGERRGTEAHPPGFLVVQKAHTDL